MQNEIAKFIKKYSVPILCAIYLGATAVLSFYLGHFSVPSALTIADVIMALIIHTLYMLPKRAQGLRFIIYYAGFANLINAVLWIFLSGSIPRAMNVTMLVKAVWLLLFPLLLKTKAHHLIKTFLCLVPYLFSSANNIIFRTHFFRGLNYVPKQVLSGMTNPTADKLEIILWLAMAIYVFNVYAGESARQKNPHYIGYNYEYIMSRTKTVLIISIVLQALYFPTLLFLDDYFGYFEYGFYFPSESFALSLGTFAAIVLEAFMLGNLKKKRFLKRQIPIFFLVLQLAYGIIMSELSGEQGEGLFELLLAVWIYAIALVPSIVFFVLNLVSLRRKMNTQLKSSSFTPTYVFTALQCLTFVITMTVTMNFNYIVLFDYSYQEAMREALGGFTSSNIIELSTFIINLLPYAALAVSHMFIVKASCCNITYIPTQSNNIQQYFYNPKSK